MGREIRRVPKDWEHPKEGGHYKPLYDNDYITASEQWVEELILWANGEHPDQIDDPTITERFPFFWEWDYGVPDPDYYRDRRWTEEEATCYQIYENVSEGTPVSPIFESLDELVTWLVGEGYSEKAAKRFSVSGWSPSFVITPGLGIVDGIEALGMEEG